MAVYARTIEKNLRDLYLTTCRHGGKKCPGAIRTHGLRIRKAVRKVVAHFLSLPAVDLLMSFAPIISDKLILPTFWQYCGSICPLRAGTLTGPQRRLEVIWIEFLS